MELLYAVITRTWDRFPEIELIALMELNRLIHLAGTAGIDAYIGIGMGATDYKQPMRQPFPYARIKVPLLNIVGSEDYPAVQLQARELESMLDELPGGSAQRRIEGAGHYFDDQNEELLEAITGWLAQIAPSGD